MTDELKGEVGRLQGVVFVDDDGNPLPPYDPSKCPECGLAQADGSFWDAHQFGPYGSMTRWHCPNEHVWVTS